MVPGVLASVGSVISDLISLIQFGVNWRAAVAPASSHIAANSCALAWSAVAASFIELLSQVYLWSII